MTGWAVRGLRMVVAAGLVGSLFVQVVMVPLLFLDLDGAPTWVRVPVVLIVLLGIVAVQVTLVCTWQLVGLVRRNAVISTAAFKYVDPVIAAAVVASLLVFALGVLLAPGEAVAPGVVLLIGGAAVLIAGVALVVFVLRAVLAQAIARDVEARGLQAELDQVI